MRFLIQIVTQAEVTVAGETVGSIGKGCLVLIGVSNTDTEKIADHYIHKLLSLRIFEDSEGKTNLSLADVDGQLLLVSQFTLYASCKKGNRPGFSDAGSPELAEKLYQYIIKECQKRVAVVETGVFGAEMKVSLTNDGPFTIMLDESILPILPQKR